MPSRRWSRRQEYMCAVGIVPADQAYEAEDLTLGHRTLLRLVSCPQECRVGKLFPEGVT